MKARGPFEFDASKMTVEEVKARLRAAGVPVDEWVDNEGTAKGQAATLPTMSRYATMLGQLRDVLSDQRDRDLAKIDELNVQMRRLRHGGGR